MLLDLVLVVAAFVGVASRDVYYVVEYRAYWGYDKNLQVGPYNFGFLDNPLLGDWVEHLPYQDGMLVNYWDTSQTNNQTARHPGAGLLFRLMPTPRR